MAKRKSSSAKSTPTPDPYLQFLHSAGLQGIGLDTADVFVDRKTLAQAGANNESLSMDMNASFRVHSQSDSELIVASDFLLVQTQAGKEPGGEPVLSLKFTFSALFKLSLPCDEHVAARFAGSEAKLVFWPYIRHFVTDVTSRMAITPIMIPLVTATTEPSAKS